MLLRSSRTRLGKPGAPERNERFVSDSVRPPRMCHPCKDSLREWLSRERISQIHEAGSLVCH